MNDKNDLLVAEAMDLISRAEGIVALAYAERPGALPLALRHLSDSHKQLEVLSVDDPKLRATAS
jgi:Flp pilus assembly protein CpaB